MQFLRQNTAVIVTVGPFYDKTDGVTIETALTITNERITLTADTDAGSAPTNILDNVTGATSGTSNDLNYITGNDAGMMQLELAAADTNRVGRMLLSITDAANHVPVFQEFFVLPQAIFDWLTGVIVPLPANVTTWLGTAAATPTVAGVPEVDITHVGGSTTNVAALATNVDAILTDTGTTLQAELDGIQADTEDIQARLPAALVGGRIDATVDATGMESGATAAIRDAIIQRTTLRGTVSTGSSTTSVTTSAMSPATSVADQVKGQILMFDHDTTTAALRGQKTDITASSASATPTLTVTALTTAPASGDTFTIG
jgi:hypothetical protein